MRSLPISIRRSWLALAAGIALINTVGNAAGFMAPFITGAIKDATGNYQAPMFVVGALMAVSALVIFAIGAGARQEASELQGRVIAE